VFEVGVEAEFSELLFGLEHGFLNGTNEIKICWLGLNLLICSKRAMICSVLNCSKLIDYRILFELS
jgi:hypothetical protein